MRVRGLQDRCEAITIKPGQFHFTLLANCIDRSTGAAIRRYWALQRASWIRLKYSRNKWNLQKQIFGWYRRNYKYRKYFQFNSCLSLLHGGWFLYLFFVREYIFFLPPGNTLIDRLIWSPILVIITLKMVKNN